MSVTENPSASPHNLRRRPTLTITAGPVSSGKSDWVRSFQEGHGDPLCLIRDEVRTQVGGVGYLDGPVDGEVEEAVTRLIHEQAHAALAHGSDVYVDGCHNHPLTRRQWEAFATENGADFRLMFFNRTLEEIIALNAAREAPHSREKIKSSHSQWEKQFKHVTPRPQHQFVNGGHAPDSVFPASERRGRYT